MASDSAEKKTILPKNLKVVLRIGIQFILEKFYHPYLVFIISSISSNRIIVFVVSS